MICISDDARAEAVKTSETYYKYVFDRAHTYMRGEKDLSLAAADSSVVVRRTLENKTKKRACESLRASKQQRRRCWW